MVVMAVMPAEGMESTPALPSRARPEETVEVVEAGMVVMEAVAAGMVRVRRRWRSRPVSVKSNPPSSCSAS